MLSERHAWKSRAQCKTRAPKFYPKSEHPVFISCAAMLTCRRHALVFGLARKSKYEELQRQNDESKAYMNVLSGQIETLRREVAELGKEMEASKRRIRQLRKETSNLRVQKERLEDSVEIFTKEREIFQKTIQNLWQATRKVRARQNSPET